MCHQHLLPLLSLSRESNPHRERRRDASKFSTKWLHVSLDDEACCLGRIKQISTTSEYHPSQDRSKCRSSARGTHTHAKPKIINKSNEINKHWNDRSFIRQTKMPLEISRSDGFKHRVFRVDTSNQSSLICTILDRTWQVRSTGLWSGDDDNHRFNLYILTQQRRLFSHVVRSSVDRFCSVSYQTDTFSCQFLVRHFENLYLVI